MTNRNALHTRHILDKRNNINRYKVNKLDYKTLPTNSYLNTANNKFIFSITENISGIINLILGMDLSRTPNIKKQLVKLSSFDSHNIYLDKSSNSCDNNKIKQLNMKKNIVEKFNIQTKFKNVDNNQISTISSSSKISPRTFNFIEILAFFQSLCEDNAINIQEK